MNIFANIFRALRRLIFPAKCVFCNAIRVYKDDVAICSVCAETITFLDEHFDSDGFSFDKRFALLLYEGGAKDAILAFKYNNDYSRGRILSLLAAEHIKKKLLRADTDIAADIIIPVPIHRSRRMERGFNQAEEIGRIISKQLGITMDCKSLIRTKNTPPLANLPEHERRKAILGAMKVADAANIKGKNILLIDDIFTLGATANECASALKSAGATSVTVFSVLTTENKK